MNTVNNMCDANPEATRKEYLLLTKSLIKLYFKSSTSISQLQMILQYILEFPNYFVILKYENVRGRYHIHTSITYINTIKTEAIFIYLQIV